ncbi:MAG: hypothetical protein ACLUR9_10565 [Christensenellales bacterium]|mgnify:CR=1 FL=1|jgi:hypothetical protein
MKQKTAGHKRFWITAGVGLIVVCILLAANLWQLKSENSVSGVKQVWSEQVEFR